MSLYCIGIDKSHAISMSLFLSLSCYLTSPGMSCREPSINLSEDLIRDYETKWWEAARKADVKTMAKMLAGAKDFLSKVVDENRRRCVTSQ